MHRSGLLPAGSYHSNSSINSSMNSSLTLTNENYSKFALKLKLFELISQLETIEQKTLENIRKVLKLIKAESSDFIKQISELRGKFQNYFAELLANDLEQSTCTEIATATFPEVQADQSYYYISTSIKQFLIPSLRSNNKMPSEDFKGILMSIDLSLPIASPQLYSPVVNTSFKHQEYTVNNASYFYCAWWRESETSGPMVIDTINKTITPIEALRSSENPSISFLIIGNKTRSQQESNY